MKLVKTPEDRRKLEKEMYDVANEIVGNVGPKVEVTISDGSIKQIPEPLALFCLHRASPDYSEIVNTWTKWIEAYCYFKKLDRPEFLSVEIDNPDLIVSWLKKPVVNPEGCTEGYIKNHPDEHYWRGWIDGKKPDIENPRFVRVVAYLCVCRVDYDAFIRKQQVAVRVSSDK